MSQKFEFVLSMPPSGLEKRVRILCDRAIAANTHAELDAILPELKTAIRDHIHYVRNVAVEVIPEAFGKRSKTHLVRQGRHPINVVNEAAPSRS